MLCFRFGEMFNLVCTDNICLANADKTMKLLKNFGPLAGILTSRCGFPCFPAPFSEQILRQRHSLSGSNVDDHARDLTMSAVLDEGTRFYMLTFKL